MGEITKIGWCDHTFNPWWGCTKVSPACDNCYAERHANRFGKWFGDYNPRRMFGDKHWAEPLKWNRRAEREGRRASVFCGSMCDVFENRYACDAMRLRLWYLIMETPWLNWLLTTKRPQFITQFMPRDWQLRESFNGVWLGTSVENQQAADERIPRLMQCSDSRLFLSMEPLLGPVDFHQRCPSPETCDGECGWPSPYDLLGNNTSEYRSFIDGVIVGGESGPGARPMDPDWARDIRDQCADAMVPFYMKQMSGKTKKEREAIPEDLNIKELAWRKNDAVY